MTAQPSLFDARQEQAENLERVTHRIGQLVVEFCRSRVGKQFYADELRAYVLAGMRGAPGSPDRILRDLRQRGVIDYVVVSRAKSLYRVEAVTA